jgi:hypothetical protein
MPEPGHFTLFIVCEMLAAAALFSIFKIFYEQGYYLKDTGLQQMVQ